MSLLAPPPFTPNPAWLSQTKSLIFKIKCKPNVNSFLFPCLVPVRFDLLLHACSPNMRCHPKEDVWLYGLGLMHFSAQVGRSPLMAHIKYRFSANVISTFSSSKMFHLRLSQPNFMVSGDRGLRPPPVPQFPRFTRHCTGNGAFNTLHLSVGKGMFSGKKAVIASKVNANMERKSSATTSN